MRYQEIMKVLFESAPTPRAGTSLNSTMKDVERNAVCRILKENGGNISESARVLKMSRQSLQYRIRKYGINVKELLLLQNIRLLACRRIFSAFHRNHAKKSGGEAQRNMARAVIFCIGCKRHMHRDRKRKTKWNTQQPKAKFISPC